MIVYILCEIQMHSLVLLFYILFGYMKAKAFRIFYCLL